MDSADSFPNWGSNGLRFYKNPWLVCPDPVYRISQFQIKTGTNPSRTGLFVKHESFSIFRDLQLSWRQHFQIQIRFLNWHGFLKSVQETRNSCTGFSKNSSEKLYFSSKPLFWLGKLFQRQFSTVDNFYKPYFRGYDFSNIKSMILKPKRLNFSKER